jgi:hypothetical protein
MNLAPVRAAAAAIAILCLSARAPLDASAVAPSAGMMAPIRHIVFFVNTGATIPAGTYARGATITDEFAPFSWTSGDVGALWSRGFTTSNAAAKITKPHIVLGDSTEFNTTATRAYIVLPGTFTPLSDGKPFTELGYWTFVLVKDGATWRVASQAWAGVSFK